jgi:hypothetical protein
MGQNGCGEEAAGVGGVGADGGSWGRLPPGPTRLHGPGHGRRRAVQQAGVLTKILVLS